jgi:hypothetical protein
VELQDGQSQGDQAQSSQISTLQLQLASSKDIAAKAQARLDHQNAKIARLQSTIEAKEVVLAQNERTREAENEVRAEKERAWRTDVEATAQKVKGAQDNCAGHERKIAELEKTIEEQNAIIDDQRAKILYWHRVSVWVTTETRVQLTSRSSRSNARSSAR